MRLRIIASVSGIFCMFGAGIAQAQKADVYERGFYLGAGLQLLRADIRGSDGGTPFNVTSYPLELVGKAGYHFFPWLAVEGFGAFGIHDDPNDGFVGNGQTVRSGETELKYHFGGAIKPQYSRVFKETTQMSVFALGGYSAYRLEGDANNNSNNNNNISVDFSRDDNAFYYGAGLSIDGEAGALVFQYVEYDRGDGLDLEGYQISVNRYF